MSDHNTSDIEAGRYQKLAILFPSGLGKTLLAEIKKKEPSRAAFPRDVVDNALGWARDVTREESTRLGLNDKTPISSIRAITTNPDVIVLETQNPDRTRDLLYTPQRTGFRYDILGVQLIS